MQNLTITMIKVVSTGGVVVKVLIDAFLIIGGEKDVAKARRAGSHMEYEKMHNNYDQMLNTYHGKKRRSSSTFHEGFGFKSLGLGLKK
jgi:hypothetical protein